MSLGELGALTMAVQQYTPDVECFDPKTEPAALGSCQDVLDTMWATPLPISFGHHGEPAIDVGLPVAFEIGEKPST